MRVIAGTLKGRRLQAPTWEGLRPTSDKLRETLFNLLAPRIDGARLLDGYAGTGAVGIEALSRGALEVTFVEHDRRARALIAKNLAACGISEGYAIIGSTVLHAIETLSGGPAFDIVFLDPPYASDIHDVLQTVGTIVKEDGIVIVEHARKAQPPDAPGDRRPLQLTRDVRSGDSGLAMYAWQP
jgi:16S rRNA (guanine(966)-N(2))-methyltransferase RsmD